METDNSNTPVEFYPMNSGDGLYSYSRNSFLQKEGLDSAKEMITEAIVEKLDIEQHFSSSSNLFCIADLGCAAGPNTFFAVQNIIESVLLKCQSHGFSLDNLEFQVFFNDQVSNDFNTLFKSLSSDKQYYAAGVPGSYHGRLFPKATLHFVHSSYALQWLSKVPKELVDKNSPAWNKGKVYFTSSSREVVEAYTTQFTKDMESFLNARAIELVSGGLMAFLIPGVPLNSKCTLTAMFDLLGSALMDLVSMGFLSEDKVDDFNLPLFLPTQQVLEALIERNGYFSIERIYSFVHPRSDVDRIILHFRAGWEPLIREHFGSEIIDKLFDQFKKNIVESSIFSDLSYKPMVVLFLTLKRTSY